MNWYCNGKNPHQVGSSALTGEDFRGKTRVGMGIPDFSKYPI